MGSEFMGRGIALPFRSDPTTGDIVHTVDEETIEASIRMFFSTRKGERVFFEDYGMREVLFENNTDQGMLDVLSAEAQIGLTRYEPRIFVRSVTAMAVKQGNMHGIRITTGYMIRATGQDRSLVYLAPIGG